ncbi:cation diffusion facilitator family transporter [Fusibacter sp. 3D3]|uniref:cation diffusion facilitator family transporter n=1 Tax=Fusibacter sp. 3D3 TaxID=1048380 RepID=UPI000855871A|nr:cation diffusion facilitator family transporter [Fusibacter sp. 3D3]GAU79803.1 cobalt-zinc-cadmium resistance protein CzcD [Fusibacter sp. 3D3]
MNEHNHDHGHLKDAGHSHDVSQLSGKKIFWVTLLNATITIAEIIGGIVSGSLALLSDAMHNLSDTIAIALSYYANKIGQKPKDKKRTYGYKRAEILAAFINASVLIALSLLLIIEAIKRFNSPEAINGNLMIIVAFIGLIANLFSVFLLEKDSHENLNIKSSYLHLLGDTVSSVGVLLGGIAIKYWNVLWIDPIVTIAISLYILREAWHVTKTTIDILMQSSPSLDYEHIKEEIEAIENVKNIHHVHAWMTDEKTIYFEAHIDLSDMLLSEVQLVYNKIEHLLKEHYDISHITLQAEVDNCSSKDFFNS